jgi:hypothetical protein
MNRFDRMLQPGSRFRFLLFLAAIFIMIAYAALDITHRYSYALFVFLGAVGLWKEYKARQIQPGRSA